MSDTPKLAPPGAGLPALELALLRLLFRLRVHFGSREIFRDLFVKELNHILKLVASSTTEEASTQILIPRIRGIEDCSRNWSVNMTLQHLDIVNSFCNLLIRTLARGNTIDQEVRIQDVKPGSEVGPEILERFKKSAESFLAKTQNATPFENPTTHNHPWFGPLNATQFHALAAIHMGIHRRQIELILKSLRVF